MNVLAFRTKRKTFRPRKLGRTRKRWRSDAEAPGGASVKRPATHISFRLVV
jgi:hypothetical protein